MQRESAGETPSIEDLIHREALGLRDAYGLTDREVEVAELLLAGRSRPFIRDELLVSINTVGAHVRNIFGKCDVHSQQELIDLARGEDRPIVEGESGSPESAPGV